MGVDAARIGVEGDDVAGDVYGTKLVERLAVTAKERELRAEMTTRGFRFAADSGKRDQGATQA